MEAKFLHSFSIPRLIFRQGYAMNPDCTFRAQQNLVRNSTEQEEESIGPRLHPTGVTAPSEWGSSLSFGDPESQKILIQPQSFSYLQSPKAIPRPSWPAPLPPHPFPSNVLLGSRVLFWLTAYLVSTLGPKKGAVGEEAKL